MKKVLYISYDGMTDSLGEGQVINYLKELTKLGYQFDILSFEKEEKYKVGKVHIKSILEKFNIGWYPQIFHTKPPLISKFYDNYILMKTARQLYKKNRYDFIHCRSYIAASAGLMLYKKYAVPYLFDMRGLWPDEKRDGGSWKQGNIFWDSVFNYYKKKEKVLFTNAEQIISLTQAGKTELLSWNYLAHKKNISVIPCCADIEKFAITSSEKKMVSRNLQGISNKSLVVSYLGSLGAWYMIDEMLTLFYQIKLKYNHAIFLILTNSSHSIVLDRLKIFKISGESVIIKTVSYSEVPSYMYASDCSISFIKPTYSKTASSPVKVGEILCMGIPLISNAVGDSEILLLENEFGVLIKDFSEKTFNKVVENIEENINIEPQKIRKAALKIFSLDEGVKKYSAVYKSMLS